MINCKRSFTILFILLLKHDANNKLGFKSLFSFGLKYSFYGTIDSFNLTTIGGRWYFDRAFVPQRLKNQSLYNKILLLQKFNYTLGKVLKPKKNQPPTSEKNEAIFLVFDCV